MTWTLPPADIFRRTPPHALPDPDAAAEVGREIELALAGAGRPCSVRRIVQGPTTTRYELEPWPSTRVRELPRLASEIQYAIGAESVRVLAPIPGLRRVGIEVPAVERRPVLLGDLASETAPPLHVPLGLGAEGEIVAADLDALPHVLVAGTTGSGKSILINSLLCSLLSKLTPTELGLILVDPKQVELRPFEGLPHLIAPVADSPETAVRYLRGLIEVMEARYSAAAQLGAKTLPELNAALKARGEEPMPYLLCVVDELADLMMASKKQCESLIVRLAQKGRAAGVHLILATQSPRVQCVTGLISANVPSRIALSTATQVDSRVILGQNGAETLLGKGDMLFSDGGLSPVRIQGAFVSSEEVAALCRHWTEQATSLAVPMEVVAA